MADVPGSVSMLVLQALPCAAAAAAIASALRRTGHRSVRWVVMDRDGTQISIALAPTFAAEHTLAAAARRGAADTREHVRGLPGAPGGGAGPRCAGDVISERGRRAEGLVAEFALRTLASSV